MIKTGVMMIGEFEYTSIFFENENVPSGSWRSVTLFFFVVFAIVMSIIIMNLLVGLAVDDIKAVQDTAALQRMAMQVFYTLTPLLIYWVPIHTSRFFRSRKKFSTTYAIVLFFFVFFSPDLFMKISNFSKTVHTIFTKFCTVILHPKGPLRVQRHQNRMAWM